MIDARRAHQKKIEHIRDAIRNDRIELYAQPLIDPEAPSQMRSYEVLTRLRDKDGQLIRPPEFLTLASQAQMSVPLDRGVIRLAFEWLAANPEALALTWKCSINLAGATMSDDTIADFIREQRANNAIPAAKVVFEITESEAIRNPAAASRLVDDLKAQGFGIALDDFGTGLATFEYLKRFPLDYLKIDGSFVRNLMTNPIDEEIILSTVRVAKRLKLRTIAEHVHNAAIYERLTDLGVSYLQGDFFGKAMPLAEMFERQAPSTAHLRQPPPRPLSGTPLAQRLRRPRLATRWVARLCCTEACHPGTSELGPLPVVRAFGAFGGFCRPCSFVARPGQARHGVGATGNDTQPAPRICVSGKDAVILWVCRGVAQSGSVLAWGARGRVFESLRPDQNSLKAGCSQEQPAFFMATPLPVCE